MKKLLFIIPIIIIIISLVLIILFTSGFVEYFYQRTMLANNPTVLFNCNNFGDEEYLQKIITNSSNPTLIELNSYLDKNDGDISIGEVGNRCPNKYQFIIGFNGDQQRIEIENILHDQTIEGIPVFLLNR